jgi:NitT/TauT family transport system permease protein
MRASEGLQLASAACAGFAAFAAASPQMAGVEPAFLLLWGVSMAGLCALGLAFWRGVVAPVWLGIEAIFVVVAGLAVWLSLDHGVGGGFGLVAGAVAVWLSAWRFVDRLLAASSRRTIGVSLANFAVPVVFGMTVVFLWEILVRGAGVPAVILPAPSAIGTRFVHALPVLAADFAQTFRGVAAGYVIGCTAGLVAAILIDRTPFLQRGLLPLGNLVSALPIVGIAPIMVMWFGFDWQSKAAVVVIMTFFPMLVNTIAGLASAGRIEQDVMKTYAASYGQTLAKLRLPAALPFIFNGLKINSTLALIGAIVAEFFGTPIVGMGFRINTEVGRMNIDMVWATILVAALAGSAFYGLLALIERRVTFWHASYRRRNA